jgi:release factor glutamine methyltransferase
MAEPPTGSVMQDGAGFAGRSLGEIRRMLQPILSAAGLAEAEREARLLLMVATGLTLERLLLDDARALSSTEARQLSLVLVRRLAHEPLSRIAGERAFYGRVFNVSPAVLDPRPETELLIDVVLSWVDATGGRQRPLSILDVGTGSGCILLTLLAELPLAQGLATDISRDALAVARDNAVRVGVTGRARFAQVRSLEGLTGPFDVLVSNPPYIPSAQIDGLDPSVRNFDPLAALDGGTDGLSVYREIAIRAGQIVPTGLIALEVGAGQSELVSVLLKRHVANRSGAPWTRVDLGGHERTVAVLTQS